MMTSTVRPAVRWQRDVPDTIRSLSNLRRPDYTDVFTTPAHTPADTTAEQWVRTRLATAPRAARLLLGVATATQRFVLGLQVAPPSSRTLAGWRIGDSGTTWFRMEARSWFMTGNLIFHRDPELMSMATFIRYDRRVGRLIWPPVSRLHRLVGIALVRQLAGAG